jgi:hypothetical protein
LPGRAPLTWAQRRRDDYGDYPSDPIEYASRAFVERMSAKLNKLQSDDIFNNLPHRIPEWEKLSSWGALINTHAPNSPLQTTYQHLTAALLATFHGWIDKALNLNQIQGRYGGRFSDLLEAQRQHYIPTMDLKPLIILYQPLNPTQKALTPFFWDALSRAEPLREFRSRAPLIPANGNSSASGSGGHTLARLAEAFNTALRRAISDSVFSPQDAPSPPDTKTLLANLGFHHHTTDFDLPAFHASLTDATRVLCAAALPRERYMDSGPYGGGGGGGGGGGDGDGGGGCGVPFFLSDHLLLTLEEKELNYLPIWADGLDDGSGGVFQEAIPPAEMGPSEPGPGYHTGWTEAGTDAGTEGGGTERGLAETSSTTAASDLGLGLGGLSLGGSGSGTAGRSLRVQESGASSGGVTEGRVGVVSVPSSLSASESFTVDDESVYADARFSPPAAQQTQGQAIERYVDEAEAEDGRGPGGDGMGELESDEEVEFGSDDGSSTLDGFEEIDFEEAR